MRMLLPADESCETEPRALGRGGKGTAVRRSRSAVHDHDRHAASAEPTTPSRVPWASVSLPVSGASERTSFARGPRTPRGAAAVGALVVLLAGAADAQVSPRRSVRDIPLPGPAPSAVVGPP